MYGSLNDFLPPHRRQATWSYVVAGHPTVQDLIEGFGVPHPEMDLILDWKGSHWKRLRRAIDVALEEAEGRAV